MLLRAVLVLSLPLAAQTLDLDRDGLDDALEQALIGQFAPTLLLSAKECDSQPAEFRPGAARPQVAARNGTIYARVAPHGPRSVEVQYFHLWARDCGRFGHDLDVEHVSALLIQRDGRWLAEAWYTAAHEGTMCDASAIARASALDARDRGPSVWVSRGKHASFLTQGACKWGCGGDVCDSGRTLRPSKLVNLGEPGAPLNGTIWAASPQWPLLAKFRPDFTPDRLALLANSPGPVAVNAHLRPTQSIVLAGDTTADALEIGGSHTNAALETASRETDSALATAADKTGRALDKAASATGKSLRQAWKGTVGFLRGARTP